MSNKREPLSDATAGVLGSAGGNTRGPTPSYRARPAVDPAFNNGRYQGAWEDAEQPFDFTLELSEVERPAVAKPTKAAEPARSRPTNDASDGQSNVITKPPPPPYSSPRRETADQPSVPAYTPDRDWDEVTPRSTSVAAALLSSPTQLVDPPPVSSDAEPASNTPSTEPTGGRHLTPKPQRSIAVAAAAPHASPLPGPVPFPLTAPVAFPISEAASPAPMAVANPTASPLPAAIPMGSASESLVPVSKSEPAPPVGYKFAPSFSIDNAPITTRGTYKREMEATVREGKKPLLKWAPTVIAAFVLPFIGASMLTSWLEAQRHAADVTGVDMATQGASPVPPHTDHPSVKAPSRVETPVAAGERVNPAESVILPQSLENADNPAMDERVPADERATVTTPARSTAVNSRSAVKSRPALDAVDFSTGLTPPAKPREPSYRVKIPEEQNAPGPRNGAHNVPVHE